MNILFKGKDNSVAIMTLVNDDVDIVDTVKKFRDSYPEGSYPEYQVVTYPISMPANRIFRDAWKLTGVGKIEVDRKKAEEIHMSRVRELRNKKLEELDKEVVRYINDSSKLAEIESRKQELRDVPQNISRLNLESPELPSILK